MSCDGRSCSPGSSQSCSIVNEGCALGAPSDEKSSGKSTSFTQLAAQSCHKQRCIQLNLGEADSFKAAVSSKSGQGTTITEFNAAVGLASVNRHQPQGAGRRLKRMNKSPSWHIGETETPQGKHRSQLSVDQGDGPGGFGKRSRESDHGEGVYWELPASQKLTAAVQTVMGVDCKRVKPGFNQLSFTPERLMDEMCKMKYQISGIDPLRSQQEKDNARIRSVTPPSIIGAPDLYRRMENELDSLRCEMRQRVSESRQVESQLLANRRVIGMLLNRLQQSLGATQVTLPESLLREWILGNG